MVGTDSHRVSRAPWYSGSPSRENARLRLQGCHLLWPLFLIAVRLIGIFVTPGGGWGRLGRSPTTPMEQRPHTWHSTGLGCSLFARHYSGNRVRFLFLGVLRCFSCPGSLPAAMDSRRDDPASSGPGFPIRASPDQRLLPPSRSLSQVATPFVGALHTAYGGCLGVKRRRRAWPVSYTHLTLPTKA